MGGKGGGGGGGGGGGWQPPALDIATEQEIGEYYAETGDNPDADGNPSLVKLKAWKEGKAPKIEAPAPAPVTPDPVTPDPVPDPVTPDPVVTPDPTPMGPQSSAGGLIQQPTIAGNPAAPSTGGIGDSLGGAITKPPKYWVGGLNSFASPTPKSALSKGAMKTSQQ